MQFISWQQFGLKKDPYDTLPLIEGGDIPIEKAFVGRSAEIDFFDGLFDSENKGCLTIIGDVGVGKTSLANFLKYIWKYNKPKLLFSFRREIEANESLLNKTNFIIEIIGSIIREIKLLDPKLLKNDLLKKLSNLVDITQSASISASAGASYAGIGGNLEFSSDKNITQPSIMSTASLEGYFLELIEFIKTNEIAGHKYSGLIIHVNNFDVVLTNKKQNKKVIQFFNEIRDILQTPDVFFLFLGPKNLFKDIISSQQRVKSIFSPPLKLNPLSKTEIKNAFNERMKLLKSDHVSGYIKPVADEVVSKLYDLYNGDIRSIMTGIRDILGQHADKLTQPLTIEDAMILLGQQRWERIEQAFKPTPEQKKVLQYFIESKDPLSQKELALLLKKAPSNISGYYFKPLKEAGIIEEESRDKKTIYYGLSNDYRPLKWLHEYQEKLQKKLQKKKNQMRMF